MAHNPDRESFFPKIEKKHGQPMKYWFQVMKDIADWKYPEQIAYLKEEHGFSQAHANALVMYSRGSKSSKRFETIDDFLKEAMQFIEQDIYEGAVGMAKGLRENRESAFDMMNSRVPH